MTSSNKNIVIFAWAESVHIQRWVKGLTSRGYNIKLISLGGEPIEGIKTHIIAREGRLSYILKANEAFNEALLFKPDLIHTHYPTGFGYWSLKVENIPSLISVWGADIIDFPSNFIKKYYLKKVLRKCSHISATSRFLRDKTVALDKSLYAKISLIPFGVTIPKELKTVTTRPPVKLCFIKGHKKKYGPDILLDALAIVKDKVPDIKLSIAGEGQMTAILKEQTSRLHLNDNVNFVGFIPNEKIYSFLSEHHIMVMPSVMDSESFGVAVLEASACGKAVIASNIGGVPEVLTDNKTGILVPPGDKSKLAEAIIELALDMKKIVHYGENGNRFVSEKYDWEISLDMMSDLYDRLIFENEK